MYEMPPILQGNEKQQIAALRDYLVRIARKNTEDTAIVQTTVKTPASTNNVDSLRGLIIKNADSISETSGNLDQLEDVISKYYVRGWDEDSDTHEMVASSDFGTVLTQFSSTIEEIASGISETYEYLDIIQACLNDNNISIDGNDLKQTLTIVQQMNGFIRRGWILDPDTNEPVLGIAIFQKVDFDMTSKKPDAGQIYYEIINDANHSPTFGLYTSKGWQFWIGGQKVGWFDSEDGMLHVSNIVAESTVRMGADWLMSHTNGFGIKYTGA